MGCNIYIRYVDELLRYTRVKDYDVSLYGFCVRYLYGTVRHEARTIQALVVRYTGTIHYGTGTVRYRTVPVRYGTARFRTVPYRYGKVIVPYRTVR